MQIVPLTPFQSIAALAILLFWAEPIQGQSETTKIVWESSRMTQVPQGSVVRLVRTIEGEAAVFTEALLPKEYLETFSPEPFYCNAEVRFGDSVLAMTSAFLVTGDTVRIRFENLPSVSAVTGGENDFINKNRLLLFALPHVIGNNPRYKPALAKTSYELNVPDRRLKSYWQEYENSILETVAARYNYYFVLERLIAVKEHLSLKTLELCYASFTDTLKRSSKGMELKKYMEQSKNLFVGLPAPEFNVSNHARQPVASSRILDSTKFTLLDFWASWCIPCRAQMKTLREMYSRIDTSRLQIVSVSIDDEYENWLKAVREENLPWQDYHDTGGATGEMSKLFAITYIPQNRIIAPTGKMVAFDLWGEGLEAFLEEHGLWKEKAAKAKK